VSIDPFLSTSPKILKRLGVNPFAQAYRDEDNKIKPTAEQKRFAWYVNQKAVLTSRID